MKRTVLGLATVLIVFAAVFGVLVLRPVPKVRAHHHGCSNAMLFGNYGFVGEGWYLPAASPPEGPANVSALVTFDGKGSVSGTNVHVVLDGTELTTSPYTFSDQPYTVNPDCSFTITFSDPSLFKGEAIINGTVVDSAGDEVIGNVLSSGTTATFEAKKVPSEEGLGGLF